MKLSENIGGKTNLYSVALSALMALTSSAVHAKMDSNSNHWNNCGNIPTEKCTAIRKQQSFMQRANTNKENAQVLYERDKKRSKQNQNPLGEYQTAQLLNDVQEELEQIEKKKEYNRLFVDLPEGAEEKLTDDEDLTIIYSAKNGEDTKS